MPVPTAISQLNIVPASNSPAGSEIVGPDMNDYLQAAFAFIAQLSAGTGFKPTASVDWNAQKLTNIAQGSIGPSSKDAVRGDQLYKVGEQKMWHGAVANIATVWGAGWQLADGTNGTADCRDRFIVGAGLSYNPGDVGGAPSVALVIGHMPSHNHGVNDAFHTHQVVDGGHAHGVNDPGHTHQAPGGASFASNIGGATVTLTGGASANSQFLPSNIAAATNIGIAAATTGIGLGGSQTGISIQNTGSGIAHENRPPYYASCIIEYTGIGA